MKKSHYTFKDLLKIMEILRSPKGCPWDARQNHKTLIKYLREETREFIDSVNKGSPKEMADELGDILLQIVFHAQIAKENSLFSMTDVIQHISRKLIRRHPHVFGSAKSKKIRDIPTIMTNWEKIKAKERRNTKTGSNHT